MMGNTGGAGLVSVIAGGAVAVAAVIGGLFYSGVLGTAPEATPAAVAPAENASTAEAAGPTATAQAEPEAQAQGEGTAAAISAEEPAPEAEEDGQTDQVAEAEAAVDETENTRKSATPTLDVVRVAPDGSAVLAGAAKPGEDITVFLDGKPIETLRVGPDGKFAGLLTLPDGDGPRVLTLGTKDGEQIALAEEEIILAPTQQPATTETTTTEPDTQTAEADQDETLNEDVAEAETSESSQTENADGAATADASPAAETTGGVAVLKSTAEGVELVQPAEQGERHIALSLDTISYSETGMVQLSGRAAADSNVRIYLNNKDTAVFAADDQGRWRGELDGIDPGIYTLRLDALDDAGKVLERIETPFKREAPEVLVAAQQAAQQSATQPTQSTEESVTDQSGGGDAPASEQTESDPVPNTPPIQAVTVQKGDTLWALSRDRYGEGLLYVKLFDANRDNIRNPDLIYPGQVFNLPD